MDVLDKIINQGYNQKLKDEQIYSIVEYYQTLDSYVRKCKYNRIIIEAISNEIIDADTFLTAAIAACANSMDYVVLIGLALRFAPNPNPNLYVVLSEDGVVHLMGYTVKYLMGKISNKDINIILSVLTLLGSKSSSYLYRTYEQKEKAKFSKNLYETASNRESITVDAWLDSQGFYDFSNVMDFMVENFDMEEIIHIGTIADVIEVAFPQGVNEKPIIEYVEDDIIESDDSVLPSPTLEDVVLCNAVKAMKYIPVMVKYVKGENIQLRMCMECGAIEAFKVLFDRGFRFSYFSMNRLLFLLKGTINKNDSKVVVNRVFNIIYMEMLKYAVNKGVRMDMEQFNMLNTFASNFAEQIAEIYSKPLWVKSCSGSEAIPLPDVVKEIAFSLNIDITQSKTEICNNLAETYRQNPETLRNAAETRQKDSISSKINTLSDYAEGKTEVVCKNTASLNGNPFEYNTDSLVYYTDADKNLWCFTPNIFENLIAEPINPYTNKKLPLAAVNKMQNIVMFLKELNINPKNIVPVSEAYNKLNQVDVISNTNTDYIVETIIRMAKTRGIYEKELRNLPVGKMMEILQQIDYNQDYLPTLTPSHRLATFCKALYVFFKKYPESISDVLEML